MLALSAACHSRQCGNQLAGSIAIGFLCAISAFLFREAVLHGQTGAEAVLNQLPMVSLVAAVFGGIAGKYPLSEKLCFVAYLLGIGLLGSCSCLCAVRSNGLGIGASLSLGWVCGILPGFIRDVALGDMASFVEKRWYASAIFLACLATLAIGCGLVMIVHDWWQGLFWQLASVLSGIAVFLFFIFFAKKD